MGVKKDLNFKTLNDNASKKDLKKTQLKSEVAAQRRIRFKAPAA